MDYFRLGVVSTNKTEKHRFINYVFSDSFYPEDIVKRQTYVLLFRDSKKQKSLIRRVVPNISKDKFTGWDLKEQFLAQSPLIPRYLEYFSNNIANQREYQQTTFLVDSSSCKFETVYYPLEVYDVPSVRKESDKGCLLIEDEQSVQQQIDMLIVVLNKSDCFKENYGNVSRIVGNTTIAKVWVVVGEDVLQEDVPLIGDNNRLLIGKDLASVVDDIRKMINQVEETCMEKQQNMVCSIKKKEEVVEEQPLSLDENETSKIIQQPIKFETQQSTTQSTPSYNPSSSPSTYTHVTTTKIPLFLSAKDIQQLGSQQITDLCTLLSRDISNLTVEQYNAHLKQIGYNRFITLPVLSFKAQFVILGILLIISLALQWLWFAGLSIVVILISMMGRVSSHKKVKREVFDQSVKRNKIVLYGKEGIVTEKLQELNSELNRRMKEHLK